MKHPFTRKHFATLFSAAVMTAMVSTSGAQISEVLLSTNDDTSGFNVVKNDHSTVLTVKGNGKVGIGKDPVATLDVNGSVAAASMDVSGSVQAATFVGDGSTLSNVRPKAAYTGGYQNVVLPINADLQLVRSVTIDVPSKGVVIVNAAGYARWASIDDDVFRAFISTDSNPVSVDPSYYIIASDLECPDSSDHYSSFAVSRPYNLGSGGSYTFYLWGENPTWAIDFDNSRVSLYNTTLTAMFFPTGGVGAGKVAANDENLIYPNGEAVIPPEHAVVSRKKSGRLEGP